jgi:flagellar motor protein MotB
VKNLADIDLDEQALIKKSRPWGWFAAGVATIGLLAFGLGYTLPLQRAHALLASEHEALAQKARELDQALGKAQSSLASTESARGGLQQKVTKVTEARQALKSTLEVAAATIERQVAGLVKAKVVQLTPAEEHLDVVIQQKKLFLPRSANLNPGLTSSLCKMLSPLDQDKGLRVEITVPVVAEEKEPWKMAGEQAAAIAQTISDKCSTPAGRLRTGASADAGADRVTLRFEPVLAPSLER